MTEAKTVAITGASGYIGSLLAAAVRSAGYPTVAMVRSPGAPSGRRYLLGDPIDPSMLDGIDTLIHCAYDFSLVRAPEVLSVNVGGTEELLHSASRAGVRRVILVSSMSAYEGTRQLYGRAKLACEALTLELGQLVVRLGLVYGPHPGGMAGALRRIAKLPVIPLVAGNAIQYTAHEDDVAEAVVRLLAWDAASPPGPLGLAHPTGVTFKELLTGFASRPRRDVHFLPVPWRLVWSSLRGGELLHLRAPFRSDSLLGLVRPAPFVPNAALVSELGISFRPFGA